MSSLNEYKILVPKHPIDILPLQCGTEKVIHNELMKNKNLRNFFESKELSNKPHAIRRRLLKNAMRITPRMSPMLSNLLDVVLKIVKVDFNVELFVIASASLNAQSHFDEKENVVYFVLNSALLEHLTQSELLFALGHEIAKQRFRYDKIDVQLALDEGKEILVPLTILKLISWERYATITCDRAGLLCCQSFSVAATTLFKKTSGVTTGQLQFNVEDYLKQLEDVKSIDEHTETPEDWFDSKPFSPLRIKALELFANSDVFKSSIGDKTPAITFNQVEETIEEFMKIMNPSYFGQEEELAYKMKDWLAYAAVLVAMADGEIVPEEVNQIISIIGYEKSVNILDDAKQLDIDRLFEKVRKLGEAVWVKAHRMQRFQMLRDLVLIAAADGTIDEYEFYALVDLATMIEVQTSFVTEVINELSLEVDNCKQTSEQKPDLSLGQHIIAKTQVVEVVSNIETDKQASVETLKHEFPEINTIKDGYNEKENKT
ncbi:MAG: TerB family tellurite resistance protein [Planctomycetes bacterium]|nr:TerB family tellurite resistance protein [Planctomycetota bacterium]